MENESTAEGPWWLPRIRWLVLLLLVIVTAAIAIPVVRYQMVCQWIVRNGGWVHAEKFDIAGLTIYWSVDEVYLKRGTIDNPPTPAYLSLSSGDIARMRVFSGLEKLVIAGYELPETGSREIASLRGLRHADLIRTNFTESDARALIEELPDCSIRFAVDGDPRRNSNLRP